MSVVNPGGEGFQGHRKVGDSWLGPAERRFKAWAIPKVPAWLETYHLTAMTLAWSLGVLYCARLAAGAEGDLLWVWGISALIALQYLTDLLDGAIGRHRDTGLVRWGFFMDHFLDFLFNAALVVGYAWMAPPGLTNYFFGILTLTSALMAISFLSFGSTNRFEIYFKGIGPTEIRLIVILMNGLIVLMGVEPFHRTVPLIFWGLVLGVAAMAYRSHKQLWAIDMAAKAERDAAG